MKETLRKGVGVITAKRLKSLAADSTKGDVLLD